MLGRAKLEIPRENVLPRVLHQSTRRLVVQAGRQQPVAVADVVGARALADSLAGHGELGATRLRDGVRDRNVGAVQLAKEFGGQGGFLGFVFEVVPPPGSVDVQPVRAARVEVASSVEVALANDVGAAEELEGLGSVDVEEDVVVPSHLVRVEEEHDVRQRVVMVDDVRQIDHGLVALVGRQTARGVVVDQVKLCTQSRDVSRHPTHVLVS